LIDLVGNDLNIIDINSSLHSQIDFPLLFMLSFPESANIEFMYYINCSVPSAK
jgi:hypothetical protein